MRLLAALLITSLSFSSCCFALKTCHNLGRSQPGVGFALNLDHGTAAVQHDEDHRWPVAIVHGNRNYTGAMSMVMEHPQHPNLRIPKRQPFVSAATFQSTFETVAEWLPKWAWPFEPKHDCHQNKYSTEIQALCSMITALKTATEENIGCKIEVASISVPLVPQVVSGELLDIIFRENGLRRPGSGYGSAYIHASMANGIATDHSIDYEFNVVLVVNCDAKQFATTILTEEAQAWDYQHYRFMSNRSLGHDSLTRLDDPADRKLYWTSVSEQLHQVTQMPLTEISREYPPERLGGFPMRPGDSLTKIVLMGGHAFDPTLRKVLAQTLQDNNYDTDAQIFIDPDLEMSSGMADPVFASAFGAAWMSQYRAHL